MKLKKVRLAFVIIVSSAVLMACTNPFDRLADEINSVLGSDEASEENTAAVEEEAAEEETPESEEELDAMYKAFDYSHLYGEGEEITIDEGVHSVGDEVVPGRYSVTTTSEYSAYLRIYDDEERYVAGEVLVSGDENASTMDFPTEVLVYIDEGDNIEVGSDQDFTLTPAEGEQGDALSPGMYAVGHDIEAGDYRVSVEDTELYGHIESSYAPAYVTARNAIGNPDEGGKESFVMTFHENDIIEITGVRSVSIEKID